MKINSRNSVHDSGTVSEIADQQPVQQTRLNTNLDETYKDGFETNARRSGGVRSDSVIPGRGPIGSEETAMRLKGLKQEGARARLGPLGREAQQAGLNDIEARQVEALPSAERRFVQNRLLRGTQHPAEGVRAYLQARQAQAQHPQRINDQVVRSMSQSVANGRLTGEQAAHATDTLARCPDSDHRRVMSEFGRASSQRQEQILRRLASPTLVDFDGRPRAIVDTVLNQ